MSTAAYLERLGLDPAPPANLDTQQAVRCCTVVGIDAEGRHEHDPATCGEWRDALDDIALPVADVDEVELRGPWDRTSRAHRTWVQAGRP